MSILLLVGDDALSEAKELVPLFYESDDCSGSALLDAPPEADGHAAAVIFDTGVFWPAGRGASRVIRSKGTLVRKSTDCTAVLVAPQLCCAAVGGRRDARHGADHRSPARGPAPPYTVPS